MTDAKETLIHYLRGARDSMLWKLDGAAGFLQQSSNLPDEGYDWPAYVARVQASADAFR